MKNNLKRGSGFFTSIGARIGAIMIAISLMGMLSLSGSYLIAATATGDAGAINIAGSLRMQSYRLLITLDRWMETQSNNYQLEVVEALENFRISLNSTALQQVIPSEPTNLVRLKYEQVQSAWLEQIEPLFRRQLASEPKASERFVGLSNIDTFVNQIDTLVDLCEEHAERRISHLRLLQQLSLLLAGGILLVALWYLHSGLVKPLRQLIQMSRQVKPGNMRQHVSYSSQNELGVLAHSFNHMSAALADQYDLLEQRVTEQTSALQRSKDMLQLLYNTVRKLAEQPPEERDYEEVLADLQITLGLEQVQLCLLATTGDSAYSILSSSNDALLCSARKCQVCQVSCCAGEHQQSHFLLQRKGKRYGVLSCSYKKAASLEPWQQQVIGSLADQLALVMSLDQQALQGRRLALLQERSAIARELHDSLAQSLSYLKIQLARLNHAQKQSDQVLQQSVMGELREGLNDAYRQLRELLTTFRLKIDEPGLKEALEQTVKEFSKQQLLSVNLDYQLQNCPLTPSEEINVLHIAREAARNALYHSHGNQVAIKLWLDDNNAVQLRVEDNGIGIDSVASKPNHYGLNIMEERALQIGGTLMIKPGASGGTEVRLTFLPLLLSAVQQHDTGLPEQVVSTEPG